MNRMLLKDTGGMTLLGFSSPSHDIYNCKMDVDYAYLLNVTFSTAKEKYSARRY